MGRFLKRFGIDGDCQELDAALTSSKAIALVITNYANTFRPDRHKHWPLEDQECRQNLESFFTEIRTLKDAVISSMEEISGRVNKSRGGDRHKADSIRRESAWHLLRLYFEVRKIKPGVTKRPITGERTGPAVRFLDFALKAHGLDVKPSTAANLVDELKNDPDLPWNQAQIV